MGESIKKLWALFNKKEKVETFGLFITILIMALTQVIGIASIMPFMDLVMNPDVIDQNQILNTLYNYFNFNSVNSFTIFIGICMFLLIILSNAISTFAVWLKMRFVWGNNHRLSKKLLKKYLLKSYGYFLIHNSADLGKNVLQEVQALTIEFLIQLIDMITYSIVALAILTFLFFTNAKVTIIAILVLGGSYILIYMFTRKRMEKAGQKRMIANKYRFKTANEAFNSIKQIQIRSKEKEFLNRFAIYSKKNANLRAWFSVIQRIPRYTLEAIAFGGIVLLVIYLIISGEETSQVVPIISLFAFAGYRLMPALQRLFRAVSFMTFNTVIVDRIYGDIFEDNDFISREWIDKNPKPLEIKKEISIDNLSFKYMGEKEPVLKNINMIIKKQEEVGIAGATGSGKSTLINVLMGLLYTDEGKIFIDDKELTGENIRNWQQNIGYVPQDIYLCDDTIAGNIAFGVPQKDIDYKTVRKVAKIANISDFIENELRKGYETVIGEKGIRLSGGQIQRLGIARALYHDPDILFLDEATSSLDSATQNSVMQAIANVAKVKTMIIIAHRLSTIQNCDKIYFLHKGKIVDSGSYEYLIKNNDSFRKLTNITE